MYIHAEGGRDRQTHTHMYHLLILLDSNVHVHVLYKKRYLFVNEIKLCGVSNIYTIQLSLQVHVIKTKNSRTSKKADNSATRKP